LKEGSGNISNSETSAFASDKKISPLGIKSGSKNSKTGTNSNWKPVDTPFVGPSNAETPVAIHTAVVDQKILPNSTFDPMSVSSNSSEGGKTLNVSEVEANLAHEFNEGKARRSVIKIKKIGQVKWHVCTYCPKSFRKPSDLIRHIRVHTQEKPFPVICIAKK